MSRTRTRGPVAGLLLALVLALVLAGAGCSTEPDEASVRSSGALVEAPRGSLPTTTKIGTVVGKMPADRRRPLKQSVEATVDGWLDAAYVGGDYPRSGGFRKAFPRFSSGAEDEARRDLHLMTNAGIARRIEKVVVQRRDLRLDVLAARGRATAVTARVHLVFATRGRVERRDRVRGRLHLTWRNGGWQVFGYDMTRGSA